MRDGGHMYNKLTHALLLTLVSVYILYIAYTLMEKALSGANEMPLSAAIVFACVFVAGAIFALIYAWKLWRQSRKDEKTQKDKSNDIKE